MDRIKEYQTKIQVVLGDITQTPTDAIMTAINSGGCGLVELIEQLKE